MASRYLVFRVCSTCVAAWLVAHFIAKLCLPFDVIEYRVYWYFCADIILAQLGHDFRAIVWRDDYIAVAGVFRWSGEVGQCLCVRYFWICLLAIGKGVWLNLWPRLRAAGYCVDYAIGCEICIQTFVDSFDCYSHFSLLGLKTINYFLDGCCVFVDEIVGHFYVLCFDVLN